MSKKYRIAIIGATGLVGRALVHILEQRKLPIDKLYLLASERSVNKTLSFLGKTILVEDLACFDFSCVQIAFFSAGSSVSLQYIPKAVSSGCIVIDNTAAFRYESQIPLIIPEVNGSVLSDYPESGIIANPNCSTIQMLLTVKPIYDAVGVDRINVATYQSVSGAGQSAVKELIDQTGKVLNGLAVQPKKFPMQIAFNVIPQIGDFQSNGYTHEEMKMVWETRKILQDESIKVNPTTVRVPVLYGHSEVIHLETKKPITVERVKKLLKQAPGVKVFDRRLTRGYPTAVTHSAHQDDVFVGRIRKDISHPLGLNLWVVADNIYKGAALNAVQIAEIMINKQLIN